MHHAASCPRCPRCPPRRGEGSVQPAGDSAFAICLHGPRGAAGSCGSAGTRRVTSSAGMATVLGPCAPGCPVLPRVWSPVPLHCPQGWHIVAMPVARSPVPLDGPQCWCTVPTPRERPLRLPRPARACPCPGSGVPGGRQIAVSAGPGGPGQMNIDGLWRPGAQPGRFALQPGRWAGPDWVRIVLEWQQ